MLLLTHYFEGSHFNVRPLSSPRSQLRVPSAEFRVPRLAGRFSVSSAYQWRGPEKCAMIFSHFNYAASDARPCYARFLQHF